MTDFAVRSRVENMFRQQAAEELAAQLTQFADALAAKGLRMKRISYGQGLVKPRSPRGFLLDSLHSQLLLPDGRLWYYHSRLDPRGIYYDARVDHDRSSHGSIPLGGRHFYFLGAFIRPYHFGYVVHHYPDGSANFEVGALIGKLDSSRFIPVADALVAIAAKL